MHNFRELIVWQKGMELVKEIYQITKEYPKDEIYVLTSQIRRAAISVPANIAEGCGRDTKKEFLRFLDISNGSAMELATLTELSKELGFIKTSQAKIVIDHTIEISKMIYNLKKSMQE